MRGSVKLLRRLVSWISPTRTSSSREVGKPCLCVPMIVSWRTIGCRAVPADSQTPGSFGRQEYDRLTRRSETRRGWAHPSSRLQPAKGFRLLAARFHRILRRARPTHPFRSSWCPEVRVLFGDPYRLPFALSEKSRKQQQNGSCRVVASLS